MSQMNETPAAEPQETPEDFGMEDFWEAPSVTPEDDATVPSSQDPAPTPVTPPAEQPASPGLPEAPTQVPPAEAPAQPAPTAPSEQPPATPAEEPVDDVAALRQELSQAMATINDMMVQQAALQQQAQGPALEIPAEPSQISSLDFLRGREVADILGDPAAFNGLLNEIATVAARAGQQAGYEQTLRVLPEVVQKSAQQQFQVQSATEAYFTANEDLKPFRKAVSMAAVEFYQKNPQASIEQILEGAGKKTREVLRMRGTAVNRVPAQPAVAMSGAQQRTAQAPTLNSVEQQIADLIDLA